VFDDDRVIRLMSSNFGPHLMFKFGDLIEFLCLKGLI